MSPQALRPWTDVVKLHPDVEGGVLTEVVFASAHALPNTSTEASSDQARRQRSGSGRLSPLASAAAPGETASLHDSNVHPNPPRFRRCGALGDFER
jgi:hypothetical protein